MKKWSRRKYSPEFKRKVVEMATQPEQSIVAAVSNQKIYVGLIR